MYFRILEDVQHAAQTYLLADLDEREAVLIDPSDSQSELVQALLFEHDLRLRYVLQTHRHASSSDCGRGLCARTGAKLVIGTAVAGVADVQHVAHGEKLCFGNEFVRVLDTPGHTPGCVSYLWRDRLFCGDALDAGACAAGDDEADAGRLFDTLTQRLFLLPGETLVFPSHTLKGRTVTTIAEERRRHARRSGVSRDSFITEMALKRAARHKPGSPSSDE